MLVQPDELAKTEQHIVIKKRRVNIPEKRSKGTDKGDSKVPRSRKRVKSCGSQEHTVQKAGGEHAQQLNLS